MKKIFSLLLITFFSTSLFAYPISPRPLRKLIIESENVVWAKVIEIGSTKPDKKNVNIWERDYALIKVNEILKGNLEQKTIKVYFCAGMICPAPGVFYDGEEVLTFIDKRDKTDGYEVHALSYGIKHGLSPSEYQLYKIRINEMQKLQEECDSRRKDEQILEWLVKCAEQPATRWEGVYELSPQSDFMFFYDRENSIRKDVFLSTAQKHRLLDALFTTDTLQYFDIPLIDIVTGINDSAMLVFLKSGLLKIDNEDLWPAQDIMERIVRMTGSIELEKLSEEFSEIYYSSDEKEKKRASEILKEFINKMKGTGLKQILLASDDSDS